MTLEQIFSLSSLLVMPFWFLMIFLPRWSFTKRIVTSPWLIAPAAVLYLLLVLPGLGSIFSAVSNPDLTGITALLGTASGATIAWVHFLAFDLFVGRWAYLDSLQRDLNPFLMAPVLFLTLMLGPVGFLCYLLLRSAKPVPTANLVG